MRRRLILMRHAKSSWDDGSASDHERPLGERGRRDAPSVGATLADLGWIPDAAWSSDSCRTRQTWELASPAFGRDVQAEFCRDLYLAGFDEILELASEWPDDAGTMLVLGHNPGMEEAVAMLSGRPEPMTTANAALLAGSGETWRAALAGEWTLERVVRPRESR